MTENTENTETNKAKTPLVKRVFWAIGIILALLGVDHYTFHYVSGGVDASITVTDSTIVTTTTITPGPTDTTKADTLNR